jgi:hypothetical protein
MYYVLILTKKRDCLHFGRFFPKTHLSGHPAFGSFFFRFSAALKKYFDYSCGAKVAFEANHKMAPLLAGIKGLYTK